MQPPWNKAFTFCLEDATSRCRAIIAADEAQIEDAATDLRALGAAVTAVEADLATIAGVDKVLAATAALNRPVDALLANAGRGLGRGFLDQDFAEARRVVDTNITGTIYLIQEVGLEMRNRGAPASQSPA